MKLPNIHETLIKFCEIESHSGNEYEFAQYLFGFLKEHFKYDILELREVSTEINKKRYNIFLKKGKPNITLSTHIDTVPVTLKIKETNTAIFANGSIDAKGQIVAQIYALSSAIEQGLADYACIYVVGEEVDSVGAIACQSYHDIEGEYLLNGEPTNNIFISKSWGIIEMEVSAKGTQAHTSLYEIDSAIHKLVNASARLLLSKDPTLNINIGKISGGVAGNVSAPLANAHLTIRIDRKSNTVIPEIREILGSEVLCEVVNIMEPLDLFVPDLPEIKSKPVKFCSDCFFFSEKVKNVMLFGPGDIALAHTVNEHIEKKELEESVGIITRILLEYAQ